MHAVQNPHQTRCTISPQAHFLHHFFFNDTATTEIYTLSLHDALPIALSLIGAVVIARFLLPAAVRSLSRGMRAILASAGTLPPGAVVRSVAQAMLLGTHLPVLAVSMVLAVAGGLQTGFAFAPAALKPKLSNLS